VMDLSRIGMSITEAGFAPEPEQSTLAIVSHHPQSVYFGMKSGFIPKESAPDEVIAGTEKDPTLADAVALAADPREGAVEAEADAPATEPASA